WLEPESVTVYGNSAIAEAAKQSPFSVKVGAAQIDPWRRYNGRRHAGASANRGGEAGACAVMALERVPADIRADV
ncbi:hypothetical protein M569_14033, partial [Genlisea aurea]